MDREILFDSQDANIKCNILIMCALFIYPLCLFSVNTVKKTVIGIQTMQKLINFYPLFENT